MTTIAVSKIKSGPVHSRIYNYLRVTGNHMTAEEIGDVLELQTEIVRRRMTDLQKKGLVRVSSQVKVYGPENVYAAI